MRSGRNGAARREPHVSQSDLADVVFGSVPGQADPAANLGPTNSDFAEFVGRLDSIDAKLELLLQNAATNVHVKEWYTPEEFGKVVGKTRYTVSEWCRLERINAEKAESGRGRNREWRISHDELKRYEREGLFSVKYPGM